MSVVLHCGPNLRAEEAQARPQTTKIMLLTRIASGMVGDRNHWENKGHSRPQPHISGKGAWFRGSSILRSHLGARSNTMALVSRPGECHCDINNPYLHHRPPTGLCPFTHAIQHQPRFAHLAASYESFRCQVRMSRFRLSILQFKYVPAQLDVQSV